MKKRTFIIGLSLLALVAICVVVHTFMKPVVAARPVKLVITDPDGQRFSGSYAADGITNSVTAIAPATITLQAKDVTYEFKRDGGNGEFRVALYVNDQPRLSTTSDTKEGIRGQLQYAAKKETYWASGF